jgi:hypothetical protein
MNQCFGIVVPQLFPYWRFGGSNSIVFCVIAVAKTIKD